MSRPIKLAPKVHEQIVALMRAGNFRETAAAVVGIQSKTIRDWRRRGARGEEPFAAFFADVSEAEAEAETHVVAVIGDAARSDWKAAAWRLEHKSPERWGYQVKLSVHNQLKGFLDWLEGEVDAETFERVLSATESYSSGGASLERRGEELAGDF